MILAGAKWIFWIPAVTGVMLAFGHDSYIRVVEASALLLVLELLVHYRGVQNFLLIARSERSEEGQSKSYAIVRFALVSFVFPFARILVIQSATYWITRIFV